MLIQPFLCALFILPLQVFTQYTSGSLNGTVKSRDGILLQYATVTLLHEPTGTVYRTQARRNGVYSFSQLAPGGPYRIEVSMPGYQTEKKEGVSIWLGELQLLDFNLPEQSVYLGNITVSNSRKPGDDFSKYGPGHIISEQRMGPVPSVGQQLHHYLRMMPQAKLMNSTEGAVSFAGQNHRFNTFYIDGAISNDVFGLTASGTNSGQAGISPLPADALSQLQVSVAPFDALLGNFTGAGINAVTRSGSNRRETSVYYSFSNAFLTGKNPVTGTKANGFYIQHMGARMEGPVIRDQLFYFINLDLQRENYPQSFSFSNYIGNTRQQQTVSILSNTLKTNYQYDAGSFLDNPEAVRANRMVIKFDWNHKQKHLFSFSYRYTDGQRENTNPGSSSVIHFRNDGYLLLTGTHSFSFEMKNKKGSRMLATCTQVTDRRSPLGSPFPRVRINDGEGAFVFGTDNSSTINRLNQSNYTLASQQQWVTGKHLVTLGTDIEYSSIFNAFIQNSFGNYTFSSLTDFFSNARPSAYQIGFPLRDQINSDQTSAAASFSTAKLSFFLNDQISAFPRIRFSYGLRFDQYFFLNSPATDTYTNETALPQFVKYWDLKEARSGQRLQVPLAVSPRIGFTYTSAGRSFEIKAGAGIFTGRIPLAWPGGAYQNNGLFVGGYTAVNPELSKIRFRPDPYHQWMPAELGVTGNKEPLNLTAKKFSMPGVARSWLSLVWRPGEQWLFTVEGLYSKNLNELSYTNINLLPPTGKAIGADNRSVYTLENNGRIPLDSNGNNPFAYAILLGNSKGLTGYAYDLSAGIAKKTRTGFTIECNYRFNHSVIMNDGTSSVSVSQWRFLETVNGRNDPGLSQSDFSAGHALSFFISKQFQNSKKTVITTLTISYKGESGSPFSYVYGNGSMTRDDGVYGANDLIYIPTAQEIDAMRFIPYTNNNLSVSAENQKLALEKYISSDAYLSKHRGGYTERNGSRTPFTHIIDLKIKTSLLIRMYHKRYRLQLSYDFFNIGNLINSNWGKRYLQPNDNFALIRFAGYQSESNLSPAYQFNPLLLSGRPWVVSSNLHPGYSTVWMGQLGLRLTLN